ncbi:MAG TPA: NAD(P)H-hydrate dehydratase [Nocardioidaceae bacterium]|nr:NAD(P)H-hydrate dehydratase [Nocardioidaceae bacterium]
MPEATQVTAALYADWPLPEPGSDKHARGTVLLVGGSSSVPGAMLLAGEAALRAGGGKLQVATTDSVAAQMAVALPEALVSRTPELQTGDISPEAAGQVLELAGSADAILLGPGITGPDAAIRLLREVVPELTSQRVVVDALGSAYVTSDADCLHHLGTTAVLTVNPSEVALTLGVEQDEVDADPLAATVELARRARAVVLCGGSDKYVASPDGPTWKISVGGPGLGVSGSGDVQAGIVTGLLARGADPEQAAVWGAWLHGSSGDALAGSVGPVGFLARELPAVVPRLLADLAG